jgi:hypothetical protein
MNETKEPVVLTVHDKSALVAQNAEDDQRLLAAKDRTEAIEGIKRGLESMKQQRGNPASEFFQQFFAKRGISDHK